MANFRPLDSGSQGSNRPVLYLNPIASYADLMEAAGWRLGAVRDLLTVLSDCTLDDGQPRAVANATRAALLLIDDAEALYAAARHSAANPAGGVRHD